MILLMSRSQFGKVSDPASMLLKSYYQDIDRNDAQLVSNVFRLLKNQNIYKAIPENEPQGHQQVLQGQGQAGPPQGLPLLT